MKKYTFLFAVLLSFFAFEASAQTINVKELAKRIKNSTYDGVNRKVFIPGSDQVIGTLAYGVTSPGSKWVRMDGSSIPFPDADSLSSTLGFTEYTFSHVTSTPVNLWRHATDGTILVVGSEEGKIYKTTDGLTYTEVFSGTHDAYPIKKMWYINGKFLALSHDRVLVGTANGATWTEVNPGLSHPLGDIAYGNGYYVGIATDGTKQIDTSTDATTWGNVVVSALTATQLDAIRFGANVFAIAGDRTGTDTVYTSSAGVTWTPHYSGLTHNTGGSASYGSPLQFINNTFILSSSTGELSTSSNGLTWTLRFDGTGAGAMINDIIYAGSKYVGIVGSATFISITSPNGTTWTIHNSATDFGDTPRNISYGNGSYVVSEIGAMLTSTDGAIWETIKTDKNTGANDVLYLYNKFIALGGDDNSTETFTSVDPSTTLGVIVPTATTAQGRYLWVKAKE